VFPQTIVQTCIVHLIRNSTRRNMRRQAPTLNWSAVKVPAGSIVRRSAGGGLAN
jgi:hypothetical protein